MSQYMTAAEARKLSESNASLKCAEQLRKVFSDIEKAANNSQRSIFYYEALLPSVENELKEKGYRVDSSFGRNEYTITISW